MSSFKITQKTDDEWHLHVKFTVSGTRVHARYVGETEMGVVLKALTGFRDVRKQAREIRDQLLSEYSKK